MDSHVRLSTTATASSLRARSHEPQALIQAIIKPIRGPASSWSAEMKQKVKSLFAWQANFERELVSAITTNKPPERRWLVSCLEIVSDLFFFGAHHDVDIFWVKDLDPRILGATSRCGKEIRMNLDTMMEVAHLSPHNSMRAAFFTIIHEALHSFLNRYMCLSHAACKQQRGFSGHGEAWQAIAKEMEKALGRAGVNQPTLMRGLGAQEERAKKPGWTPSREYCLRFFGGICPVTEKDYRGWREKLKEKLKAFFRR